MATGGDIETAPALRTIDPGLAGVGRSSTHVPPAPTAKPAGVEVVDGAVAAGDDEFAALVDLSREIATGPLRRRNIALLVLSGMLVLLLVGLLMHVFVVQSFVVSGDSMRPAASDGDHVVVDKLSVRWGDVGRGDVVVFHPAPDTDRVAIKRVVAVAGEIVEFTNCRLLVDGQPVRTGAPPTAVTQCGAEQPARVVPAGTVFVMGDQPAISEDSRQLGPIPTSRIVGRARFVVWPLGAWQGL